MAERFPRKVDGVLRQAGWPTQARLADAVEVVCRRVGGNGATFQPVHRATVALSEFGGLHVAPGVWGSEVRCRPFSFDPTQVAATAETLADLGRVLNTRLFPIGMEGNHESVIAMDEAGRVFAVDHAGAWFLGATIDAAIITLVEGTRQPRVDSRGEW
jgi:SUKH-3 immunity protein